MKTFLLATITTVALATSGYAQTRVQVVEGPLATTAVLAEYLTTCGGKAKPAAVRAAQALIDRTDYALWLKTAGRFHLVRDQAATDRFCLEVRDQLNDLLEPIDYSSPSKSPPPPPGDLDLNPLVRRIVR
jgi:hypothetical protein